MVPVRSSVILMLVPSVHSYHVFAYFVDNVCFFTCITLNSNAVKNTYYRDGHYTILVLIKNLKLASVLQMLP